MRIIAIIFSVMMLMSLTSSVFAEICENTIIAFPYPDAQTIAITFDKLEMCENLLNIKDEIIAEQGKNIELLEKANKKLMQALKASEQANEALKQIIEVQKEREELQAQKCAEDIKKAKPGFFRDAGIFGLGGITGAIALIAGLLAL